MWMEKVHHPNWTPKRETPAMRWGKLLEPLLAAEYSRSNHVLVIDGGFVRHPNGVQQGHLDGLVVNDSAETVGVWEGKTGSDPAEWEGGVPEHYVPQCQQYMAITGLPWCDVSVLLPGGDFRTFRLESDIAYQIEVEERVLDFWNRFVVTGRIPPEGESIPEIVYPRHVEPEQRLTAEEGGALDLLVRELLEVRKRRDRYAGEYDALVKRAKMVLGENGGADGPTWTVHYRTSKAAETTNWEHVATGLWNTLAILRRLIPNWQDDPVLAPHLARTEFDVLKGLYTMKAAPQRPFLLRSKEDKE